MHRHPTHALWPQKMRMLLLWLLNWHASTCDQQQRKGKASVFYASFHWNLKWFVDLLRMHEVKLFGTEFYNEIKRSRFKAPIWMSFFSHHQSKRHLLNMKKVLYLLPSYDLKIRGYINLHFPFFSVQYLRSLQCCKPDLLPYSREQEYLFSNINVLFKVHSFLKQCLHNLHFMKIR